MARTKQECGEQGHVTARTYIIHPMWVKGEGLPDKQEWGGQRPYSGEYCVSCDGFIGAHIGPAEDYGGAEWSVKHQTFVRKEAK
jgi:hypothetical protein